MPTLPNRDEELPEQRYYDPQEPDNWADILHDVLAELSINALVSGTDPSNHSPHDGTLFIPTDGGAWYLGDGSVWNELLAPGDYLTAAENASISGSWDFTTAPTIDSNTVWHAGNDGDGSGLDADRLDGTQASGFATSNHTHALGDLSNVSASGEGSGNGLNADQVDGYEASELKGNPDLVTVNSYSGADPSGGSTSDSAFSSAVSDANAHDTVLFYDGTFLLENYHDISKPLTIKCAGAELKLTKTASSGSARAQIRFMGGGVQAQASISSTTPAGSRTIPVADASIFSSGDSVLLMNAEYSYEVDTPSQFATVESADTTNGNIVIDSATDHDFSGTAHRVSLIESPRFVNVSTFGGGDIPILFRWCEDARYDRCEVTEYLQTPLAAVDCYKPKWYDVEAYNPLSRGSGEGEAVCLYRTTDAYVESPRIYDCRRGVDIAWGCTNSQIIDPVVKSFSISAISVHQSNVGGDVRIVGGKLVADPDGLTGHGITGSPNETTISVQGTDIITRRSGIHASGVTKISDVTISPGETVSSGVGLQISGGPVQADGIIIDDPDGRLNQAISVTSGSRPIRGVDIDARIRYNADNAVYFETAGNPIEDVDLSGTIQSDSTAPDQAVFFYSADGAFDNIDYSMDILNHAEYGIRLDGGTKNGEFRIHDAVFDCDPGGVPILDYSGWGGAEQVWIKNCTLLYDSGGHSDSVHLASGTVDYCWVVDNYAPGAINIDSAVTNSSTRGNMG